MAETPITSLFSGAGGLDLGFHNAGFQTVWANEFDKHIWATFKHNFPATKLEQRSITDVHVDEIPDAIGLIGGPPCQSWSEAGSQRGIQDARGQLFHDYIRVLAENVSGILQAKHRGAVDGITRAFAEAGYEISITTVNANDFGVPQERHRVFFVGYRKDLNKRFVMPPSISKPPAFKDAIWDLRHSSQPALPGNRANPKLEIPNHEFWIGDFSSHYMSRNRVRTWSEASFTIQASGRHAPFHPQAPRMQPVSRDVFQFVPGQEHLYRRLSIREAARVQSFPDSFVFLYDNLADGYKMVGNAVPPKLAEQIAQQIRADLFESTMPNLPEKNLRQEPLFDVVNNQYV
jgi:DNA (cytosine-5)-methyltransferase 1